MRCINAAVFLTSDNCMIKTGETTEWKNSNHWAPYEMNELIRKWQGTAKNGQMECSQLWPNWNNGRNHEIIKRGLQNARIHLFNSNAVVDLFQINYHLCSVPQRRLRPSTNLRVLFPKELCSLKPFGVRRWRTLRTMLTSHVPKRWQPIIRASPCPTLFKQCRGPFVARRNGVFSLLVYGITLWATNLSWSFCFCFLSGK